MPPSHFHVKQSRTVLLKMPMQGDFHKATRRAHADVDSTSWKLRGLRGGYWKVEQKSSKFCPRRCGFYVEITGFVWRLLEGGTKKKVFKKFWILPRDSYVPLHCTIIASRGS